MHKRIFIACTVACLLWPALAPARPVNDVEFSSYREVSEVKFNAAKESRQKDQEKTEVQIQNFDKRMEIFESHLANIAALLIALLSIFGVVGYISVNQRAREEAKIEAEKASKDWFKNKGRELEQKVNKLLDDAKKDFDDKIQAGQAQVEALQKEMIARSVNKLLDDAKKDFDDKIQAGQAQVEPLQKEMIARSSDDPGNRRPAPSTSNDALTQADQLIRRKPQTDYTFEDWNMRAFNAYHQQDLDASARYWLNAARNDEASDIQAARAMLNAGINLATLRRHEESKDVYKEIITRFGTKPELELRDAVGRAMVNIGVSLAKVNQKYTDAITQFGEVISNFGDPLEPEFRVFVALAIYSQGNCFYELKCYKKAITAYDKVIKLFGEESEPGLRELVAKAKKIKDELIQENHTEDE